jgi:putative intracellular protease/amidase
MRYAQALKSVGDAEVVDALLPVLLQTLDDDVGRLDAAFEVRQLAAARAVLHGLKGVLPMFCSDELARQIVELAREMLDAGKPVAAVCHGPQLLAEAEVLRGRRLTSSPSIRKDLEHAGAHWVDQETVEDGNLLTARRPADLPAFCNALVRMLVFREAAHP